MQEALCIFFLFLPNFVPHCIWHTNFIISQSQLDQMSALLEEKPGRPYYRGTTRNNHTASLSNEKDFRKPARDVFDLSYVHFSSPWALPGKTRREPKQIPPTPSHPSDCYRRGGRKKKEAKTKKLTAYLHAISCRRRDMRKRTINARFIKLTA